MDMYVLWETKNEMNMRKSHFEKKYLLLIPKITK